MGRLEAYKGLIEYYKDAGRLCEAIENCTRCPLHVVFDDGSTGCNKTLFDFKAVEREEEKDRLKEILYKMYVVSEWADKHPEEDTNDII